MGRDEVYSIGINVPTTDRTLVNDMAYDEDVPLARIDIEPDEVVVEYDNGHKQTYVTMKEATARLQRKYKFVERDGGSSGTRKVRIPGPRRRRA